MAARKPSVRCHAKAASCCIFPDCASCTMPTSMRTRPSTSLGAIEETAGTTIAMAPATTSSPPRSMNSSQWEWNRSAMKSSPVVAFEFMLTLPLPSCLRREPECIGLIEADIAAGIPRVVAFLRHVAHLGSNHDRLADAVQGPDREDLIGVDSQYLLPRPATAVV